MDTTELLDLARDRAEAFGYEMCEGDEFALIFAFKKVEDTIKNLCNVGTIPDGLEHIAVDMTVGEFLFAKKTFAPESLKGIDLDYAVKQIELGDTNVSFAVGAGSLTPEQRLDSFIDYLRNGSRGQLTAFRKLRW